MYNNDSIDFLKQLWPDLLIMFKWSNTYHEANRLPLVHLLRCLMRPITLSGGSVRAWAPGTYLSNQFSEYFLRISNHITLSSAKYMFASLAVCLSFSNPLKNDFRGSPEMAAHLKVQKAPGSTEMNPKSDSNDLSR